jgi:hypothetical protein
VLSQAGSPGGLTGRGWRTPLSVIRMYTGETAAGLWEIDVLARVITLSLARWTRTGMAASAVEALEVAKTVASDTAPALSATEGSLNAMACLMGSQKVSSRISSVEIVQTESMGGVIWSVDGVREKWHPAPLDSRLMADGKTGASPASRSPRNIPAGQS